MRRIVDPAHVFLDGLERKPEVLARADGHAHGFGQAVADDAGKKGDDLRGKRRVLRARETHIENGGALALRPHRKVVHELVVAVLHLC